VEEAPAQVAAARPDETAQPVAEKPATPEPAAQTPAAPVVPEPAPAASPAQPAQAGTRFTIVPPNPQTGVGEPIEVNVVIQDVSQLFGLPMRIRYDRNILRLVDIKKGPFLESDGQDLIFARNIRAEVGQAAVNISRFPGTGGIDGGGVLITMVFEGVSAGTGTVQVTPTAARDANAKVIQIPPAEFKVSVR
jgi:hypothetical protein